MCSEFQGFHWPISPDASLLQMLMQLLRIPQVRAMSRDEIALTLNPPLPFHLYRS